MESHSEWKPFRIETGPEQIIKMDDLGGILRQAIKVVKMNDLEVKVKVSRGKNKRPKMISPDLYRGKIGKK